MSRIRGRDTRPEMLLRRGLHARGERFRLHRKDLPGRPDLVFPRHRAVIFVHGCFWHGHDCPRFRLPKTNTEFWDEKVRLNRVRDASATAALKMAGWRTLIVWECALTGPAKLPLTQTLDHVQDFLIGASLRAECAGAWQSREP
ncbi:MAG TPA: very short patch repair endonuclease [Alphaproteobacteria bacterium]|nr:very short patch repair endonuclease [Alphaproteobacteria bacterium]